MKSIGLRFFTVYGEWGRPDMLMMKYMIAKNNQNFFLIITENILEILLIYLMLLKF